MISLEECRKHLPETELEISDERLIELRRQIYNLCELILEDYLEQKMNPNSGILKEKIDSKDH